MGKGSVTLTVASPAALAAFMLSVHFVVPPAPSFMVTELDAVPALKIYPNINAGPVVTAVGPTAKDPLDSVAS